MNPEYFALTGSLIWSCGRCGYQTETPAGEMWERAMRERALGGVGVEGKAGASVSPIGIDVQ